MAKFEVFSPVATGLFFEKMAKKGHFWAKWPKKAILAGKPPFWGFSGCFGRFGHPAGGCFTSTPRGGALRLARGEIPEGGREGSPLHLAEGDAHLWVVPLREVV